MWRYLLRALVVHVTRQRTLLFLTVAGVALGVAAVFSVHLLNRSAVGAFGAAVTAISGDVDLSVAPAGPSLPERAYVDVLADRDVASAAPVVRGGVRLHASGIAPFSVDLVGVDLLQSGAAPLAGGGDLDTAALLAEDFAALPAPLLAARGLAVGDIVEVTCGTRRARLRIAAALDLRSRHPLASDRTVVVDVARAQDILGKVGMLDRVDVVLREGAVTSEARARLAARVGPAAQVLTPDERAERAAGLLDAFRLNLTALSVVSLLVGLFLVRGSVEASLLRRRRELGLLRSLGASRAQVLGMILAEVAAIAFPGVALGLWLGHAAAAENLRGVSATITNLYLLEAVERLDAPPWLFLVAAAAGVVGALVGALRPAWMIATDPPRELLAEGAHHESLGRAAPRMAAVGGAVVALAFAWYLTVGQSWRPSGFALGAAVLLALPLLAPMLVRGAAARARPTTFGLAFAWRSLSQRLRTGATAVASLALAVSMLLGISLLLSSFRQTVKSWIDATLRADVYVSTESFGRDNATARIDDATVAALREFPGVRALDSVRRFPAWIGARRVNVLGVDLDVPEGPARFPLIDGDEAAVFARVAAGEVLLGEPLARKLDVDPGDPVSLPSPGGETAFRVAGVYRDYSSELGSVVMARPRMDAVWGPAPVNATSLFFESGADAAAVEEALRERFADDPLVFNANARLRAEAMRVFDQTFVITRIVQALALVIAACAVALALLVIGREAAAEIALLRSIGASRRQVFLLFGRMGALIGLAGVALGAAGGAALAWVLVFAVNRAYFGWTIEAHPPTGALVVQLGTIALAVVAASVFPALRASRTPATELSRERA